MAEWRKILTFLVSLLVVFLISCSSSDSSEDSAGKTGGGEGAGRIGNEIGSADRESSELDTTVTVTDSNDKEKTSGKESSPEKRMVIQEADLYVRVEEFAKAQQSLEKKAKQFGGFIVNSTVCKDANDQMSGTVLIRVPSGQFEKFIHEAEKEAAEVVERNILGDDVTEAYVDLESRLKSKRAVETRLLEFMNGAQRTEDLLKISSDLAVVQEEIEQIIGKMNYYKDRASLSTIKISMYETKIIVNGPTPKELNTWERTKKQFQSSVNLLLSALSGFVVFFIGNLPVLLSLAAAATFLYLSVKKLRKNKN